MGFGIAIRVWGDYACFTRPEMKVERVSYDIMTPSAARGIIEAIYWKPSIRWVIDKIHVLNEIEFTNVRRNEVSEKISTNLVKRAMKKEKGPLLYLSSNEKRQQRAGMVLKNVDYIIEAHFEFTIKKPEPEDTIEKHYNIALRRLRKGQHFHAPYLGTREFGANVALIENEEIPTSSLRGKKDLGWMLYDLDFTDPDDIQPLFFKAELNDGILDLSNVQLSR
jgi:CRISPR-associated protein Cas5d